MGKLNKEELISDNEETPLVRTLYDRRTHAHLLDEDVAPIRIFVQPAKESTTRKRVTEELRIPLFDAAYGADGSVPVKPPRKFVPMTPPIPERSFARKWRGVDWNGNEAPNYDELTIPRKTTTFKEKFIAFTPDPEGEISENESPASTPSEQSEDSGVSDNSRSSSEAEEEFPPLPADYYESTPVEPFSTSASDGTEESAPPSGSSSGTSIMVPPKMKPGADGANEQAYAPFRRYRMSTLKLFGVGGVGLEPNGTTRGDPVSEFYGFKDSNVPKLPLVCDYDQVRKNLKGFAITPVAIGAELHCHITRDNKWAGSNLYHIFLEETGNEPSRTLILTARRRKLSATCNYLISTDPAELWRNSSSYVGKLRSNLLGTEFTIYDGGNSPKRFNYSSLGADLFNYRQELGAVIYETNVLGTRGPRKMKVLFPSMLSESKRCESRPEVEQETMLQLSKKSSLPPTLMKVPNKFPVWNNATHQFLLDVGGRFSQSSVKNFQIFHPDRPDYLIVQFGKVDEYNFKLDFNYPLCPLQAFGMALTSLHSKIGCE